MRSKCKCKRILAMRAKDNATLAAIDPRSKSDQSAGEIWSHGLLEQLKQALLVRASGEEIVCCIFERITDVIPETYTGSAKLLPAGSCACNQQKIVV